MGVPLFSVKEHGSDSIVAVGKNIGLNDHPLADHSFRREPAAIDLWFNALDNDPFSAVLGRCHSPLALHLGIDFSCLLWPLDFLTFLII